MDTSRKIVGRNKGHIQRQNAKAVIRNCTMGLMTLERPNLMVFFDPDHRRLVGPTPPRSTVNYNKMIMTISCLINAHISQFHSNHTAPVI